MSFRALAFLLALCAAAPGGAFAAEPAKAHPGEQRESFPTFGIEVSTPPGWSRLPPLASGVVVRWGRVDPLTHLPRAVVAVVIGPVKDATLEQYTAHVARLEGGKVSDKRAKVAGEPAVRVDVPPRRRVGLDDSLQPAGAIVTSRGKFAYVLSALTCPGASAEEAVESVRASWKWIDIEPPSKHVKTLGEPVSILEQFRMRVPAAVRPHKVKQPATDVRFADYNFMNDRTEMVIDYGPFGPGQEVKAVLDYLGTYAMRQYRLAQPLKWTKQPGPPVRWVANPFTLRPSVPDTPFGIQRFVLIELGERDKGLLTIQYAVDSNEEKADCETAVEEMIKSIQPPSDESPAKPDAKSQGEAGR